MFNKSKITRNKVITTILVIMIMYFSFYLFFGQYGFIQYTQLKRESSVKKQSLEEINSKNDTLESKIHSLNSSNIDKDLLEEQVRENLGYVAEDEIIIYYE